MSLVPRQFPNEGRDPFEHRFDAILAEIAINVQLPPGLHALAVARYEAIRKHIERDGSPLQDLVRIFYPQGSMAIDATISSRWTDEDYDLDVVADLHVSTDSDPDAVLDLLYEASKGYNVKRVVRQTRCVTFEYSDGMHIDVTPAVRLAGTPERESVIFHAKENSPAATHMVVDMNAWGFARWFTGRTPYERKFADAYSRRLREERGWLAERADAEVEDVPPQTAFEIKNSAVVALQLLKRMRNVVYGERPGRIPPSVMLSCFAGHAASPDQKLSDMLIRLCRFVKRDLDAATAEGRLVHVCNPAHPDDVFTDRWPETLTQQREFSGILGRFVADLEAIRDRDMPLVEVTDRLRTWFGKGVVGRVIEDQMRRTGKVVADGGHSYFRHGGLRLHKAPGLLTGVAAVTPVAARPHTFYGDRVG
ncbi:nucleotidyltransferase domain-containing protein [Antarcticirhabdus aurantiaca]|uniref:Nucleotidyltransferase n=1 Tax=Antarcticirhabdus aurantiaca TaxID=2606717 RepID=A0ACD4NW18_9HYPH|nr:nucleotidyltransferase [Antarcticirhabdus aurantiaca]WAJ31225.1 nucleotidyltransferase [Jeongeuplla avenae]